MATARLTARIPASCRPQIGAVAAGAIGVLAFTLLTAAFAAVRIPVPGTPVPITLQTLAVLLAGFALGPTRGAASQALYLALGLSGLPVFAAAGIGTAPFTAGYLIGFAPAAITVGIIHRRLPKTLGSLALAATAGTAVIFISGVGWLAWMLNGNLALALQQGLYPFLPGAVLKGAAAVAIVQGASAARRRLVGGPAGG